MQMMARSSNSTPMEQRIEDLLSRLTLREKVALLSGTDSWHTATIERLGIPPLTMTDGPHGVRAPHPEAGRIAGPATAFPTGISMASSWNPDLIEQVGAALGEETRAMGCDVLLGPCVNIMRTPLAGRNFESYSEDPYLAGRIGVAWVKGVQSRQIGTSLKHFACNNQETERFRGSSVVDERTLREIYLPAFERVVKEARPWTVMCAYNRVNGVYASQNHHLLNEILKEEWGFDGVVVSDWAANHTTVESVSGGLDLEMPGPAKYYGQLLVEAVDYWQIDAAVIDKAVRRMLRLLIRCGKLDDPATLPPGSVNTPEHRRLARSVAEEAITLLKNEHGLLPLDANSIKSIAVIGPNAAEARLGGGGSSYVEPPYRVSPLEGLQTKLGDHVEIRYEQGCDNLVEPHVLETGYLVPARGTGHGLQAEYFNNPEEDNRISRAVELARASDVVIIFAGLPERYETEGHDRPDWELPGRQAELIRAVARANQKTAVVLNCGAPVAMPWIEDVPALVLAYYPGQEGGHAIADILTGEVNPSGKLTVTFPGRMEDNPTFINYPGTREVRYGEGVFVGYRYYDMRDIEPLFPFGHGLSYTTFDYNEFQVPAQARMGEPVQVSVRVKNSGPVEGKEVVQLYVHDKKASLPRPPKELKGFAKVSLKPGESQTVTFTLDQRALSFYDPDREQWVAEAGEFEVLVGSSSRDIRARATFSLA
jgi:beta-glucosidase